MYHPLIEDLSKIKDNELDNKILDLNKKYFIAARAGQGNLCSQISIVLESLKEEQSTRHKKMLMNAIKKDDNDLENLINVD